MDQFVTRLQKLAAICEFGKGNKVGGHSELPLQTITMICIMRKCTYH